MIAAEAGDAKTTRMLVQENADVNLTTLGVNANGTKRGQSALNLALGLSLPHTEVDETGKPKKIQPDGDQIQAAIDCAEAIFESENLDIAQARQDLAVYQRNPDHNPVVLETLNNALAAKEAQQQQTQQEIPAPSPEDQVELEATPEQVPATPEQAPATPEQAPATPEQAKPEPQKREVKVARHQYSGKRKGQVMSHEDVVEFAATRNAAQMDPEEHQRAIARIQEMENQGLLPKGPNGSSNAEVYLYRARQSGKYYHRDEEIRMADGTYQPVSQALASNDVNHKNVVSMLTGSDNIDAQSADVATVLLRTEGCISATGEARTDHRIPVRNNKSFQAGMESGIGVAEETEIIETPSTPQAQEGAEQPAQAGAGQQGQEGAEQPGAPQVPSTGASQGAEEQTEPAEKPGGFKALKPFTMDDETATSEQGVYQNRDMRQSQH